MNVVCCLPAFGSKRQLVPARLPTLIRVSVSMQPPPVASNPGFSSRILSPSTAKQNPGRKAWIRGYPYS